ncbi:MAG TPA: hypothetical protein VGP41_14640 [Candidatus Lustribacter sp.]|jgi:hypothetical protein|nr:hypothetical protein [Candidatus Lustribacter sp.]
MDRNWFRSSRIAALAAVIVLWCASPARSDEPAAPAAAPAAGPAIVLARLSSDPRTPDGYSGKLELHVKMHSFPFIGVTVHGTSSYRKPGLYHYQLQNLPRLAAKFDDLHYDLGDPTSWGTRYDIVMAPQSTDDVPVLRLTPKKPGGQVAYLDIETDAKHARMLKATWTRHDGGTIVLTQTYAALGAADVVTQQRATVDIPHFRADLTATYTDLTLDTPTFAGVSER